MNRLIPAGKMSKRQKKTLDKQKRAIWSIKPTTKIVKSKKVYDRKKQPRNYEPYDSEAVAICFESAVVKQKHIDLCYHI